MDPCQFIDAGNRRDPQKHSRNSRKRTKDNNGHHNIDPWKPNTAANDSWIDDIAFKLLQDAQIHQET